MYSRSASPPLYHLVPLCEKFSIHILVEKLLLCKCKKPRYGVLTLAVVEGK